MNVLSCINLSIVSSSEFQCLSLFRINFSLSAYQSNSCKFIFSCSRVINCRFIFLIALLTNVIRSANSSSTPDSSSSFIWSSWPFFKKAYAIKLFTRHEHWNQKRLQIRNSKPPSQTSVAASAVSPLWSECTKAIYTSETNPQIRDQPRDLNVVRVWSFKNLDLSKFIFSYGFLTLIVSVLRSIEAKWSVLKGMLKTKEFQKISVFM